MASHALASGMKVPGNLLQTLFQCGGSGRSEETKVGVEDKPSGSCGELHLRVNQLAQVHERLADIVTPATPRTIAILNDEKTRSGFLCFLGPVPLIRQMMIVALLFLASFIYFGISPAVNARSGGILSTSGEALLLNLMFYLSAAGLGACFAGLFQANRYIDRGTFDPKYASNYWIRLALGLIAGIMLAELIPLGDTAAQVSSTGGALSPGADGAGGAMPSMAAQAGAVSGLAKPTLAMLGGFSADVVYRILARLVGAVETLVRGDTQQIIEAQQMAARARMAESAVQGRMRLAADLMNLQRQLGEETDPQAAQERVKQILNTLMPDPTPDPITSATTTASAPERKDAAGDTSGDKA